MKITLKTQSLPFPVAATVGVGFVTGPSSIDRETIDTQLKILQAYTDGKMKRYGLLFSVNGGAFALARFSSDKGLAINPAVIASGAIFFTVLMTLDIWMFGIAMRKQFESVQDGLLTARPDHSARTGTAAGCCMGSCGGLPVG
jgi:hypothetical protein